jgi:hypothetical protein
MPPLLEVAVDVDVALLRTPVLESAVVAAGEESATIRVLAVCFGEEVGAVISSVKLFAAEVVCFFDVDTRDGVLELIMTSVGSGVDLVTISLLAGLVACAGVSTRELTSLAAAWVTMTESPENVLDSVL